MTSRVVRKHIGCWWRVRGVHSGDEGYSRSHLPVTAAWGAVHVWDRWGGEGRHTESLQFAVLGGESRPSSVARRLTGKAVRSSHVDYLIETFPGQPAARILPTIDGH